MERDMWRLGTRILSPQQFIGQTRHEKEGMFRPFMRRVFIRSCRSHLDGTVSSFGKTASAPTIKLFPPRAGPYKPLPFGTRVAKTGLVRTIQLGASRMT